jgi:non-specific protein-tyrosine kinase
MGEWRDNEAQPGDSGSSALAVARRRWWVIALTTVLAVGVTAAVLSQITPVYRATAVLQAPITTGVQTPTDLTYIDRLMNTYTQLAQQATFRTDVARQLGRLKAPPLTVTVEPNTELLDLAADDRSPAVAQRTANLAASVLVSQATGLEQGTSQASEAALSTRLDSLASTITALKLQLAATGSTAINRRLALQQTISGDEASYQALVQQRAQLQLADATRNQSLSIVQSASLPSSAASPKWGPVLALALGLGLLGGLALAFLLERFAPRLYTMEAIEAAADANILAAIPRVSSKQATSSLYNGGSPAQEAFGVLAVHILAESTARRLRTLLVTSRSKGDGKSTIAANLAAELARTGRSVVLVDADMRSPSAHEIFGLELTPGLSDLLGEPLRPEVATVHPERVPDLHVIPAGSSSTSPAQLLASERLQGLLEHLVERFDFVVVDAPPLVVSDPLSIARLSDEVLLVVGGGEVQDREVQAAKRQLSSIGADHVSVVVNRWRGREANYSYAYPGAS